MVAPLWIRFMFFVLVLSNLTTSTTVRDYVRQSQPPEALRKLVNYLGADGRSHKDEGPVKMSAHTRDVIEEITAFAPKRGRHWFGDKSLTDWILDQEYLEGADDDEGADYDADISYSELMLNKMQSDMSEFNETLLGCQTDLDTLLGALYQQIDSKFKKYREFSLARTISKLDPNLKSVCFNSLEKILQKMEPKPKKTFPAWGWSFVDATAKPPAAILGGQLQWVGGFEMCNNIKVNYTPENDVPNITRTFNGKYCRIKFGQKDKFNTTTNITSDGFLLSLGYGVCLPDTCTRDGLLEHLTGRGSLIDSVLNQIGFEVRNVFCGNELNFETDERAKLAFGIILVLVVLVACATVYDLIIRPVWIPYITQLDTDMFHNKQTNDNSLYPSLQLDSNGHPITMSNGHVSSDTKGQLPVGRQSSITSTRSLLSKTPGSSHGPDELYEKPGFLDRIEAAFVGFSASVGFRKIFDVTNLGSSHLPSLDGIRFLSVVFAIGGNTCLFGILYTESITVSNLVHKLAELPHQLAFQPVINYSFSTDSFLVVSGTVVSYHWLRRLKKAGGRLTLGQFIHFYLHRYWSLMPMMMLVVMMYTCLYKYLLSGPISPPEITDAENCRTSWWGNLLMLGNLINTDASCLAWTWYVPMMFQLHVITPIILIPLSFKRWAGWITLSAMYVVFLSAVSGVVKNHIYGDSGAWYFDYLQTPWCRAGPYFIGIAVGIILHERYFDKIPKNIITRLTSWFLMAMSVGTILLLAFITYTKYRKDDPIKWTEDQTISYHVFARSAWGLAVAYMIVASETGFGGFIKSMISHSCMTPPSRLAYPVFIIHAIFIFKYAYSQYDTIYINFNNLLYMFFGHLVLIFLLGMLIALIFFTPFQGLEFAFFGARSKLDLITAGSCPQEFRDLNMSHDHHHVMQGEDKIQDLASDRDIAMQSFNNLVET